MLVDSEKLKELCNIILNNETNNLEHASIVDKIYTEYFEQLLTKNHNGNITTNHVNIVNKSTNLLQHPAPSADDVWIFGYGSLVWKADFPYIDSRPGYICGFKRRFYQNSIDHRGTAEKPGRVVTLLPAEDESERVYGIAYRIAAAQKQDVLQHLDYREKNGYERREVMFFKFNDDDSKIVRSFPIILYIATQTNESYAGNICELPNIAQQIFTSAGPSGRNRDYLFNLAKAMRQLFPGVNDEHLFALEESVLQLIKQEEPVILEAALKTDISNILDNLAADKNIAAVVEQLDLLKLACSGNDWKERILTEYFKKNSVPQN